jgi:hypothetical protein
VGLGLLVQQTSDHAALTLILSVNPVQQDVQQRGRIITRVHDRTRRRLAAKVALSWGAPVVGIEGQAQSRARKRVTN